ncbi:MAG: heparan-alpha-glucosaminide N-acetyltransferase domain-containing protein [Halofilum sp. (in: g-proteobacteria)]
MSSGVAHGADASGPTADRLAGIDLARALAMIGMLMVHVGPLYGERWSEHLYALPHGRAAILFMLVAGIGVTLLAAGRSATPFTVTSRLLWRAALLLPLGLVLQDIDTGRLVILQTYAAMFVVAAGLVYLPDRWLLIVAGASAVGGPIGFLLGRMHEPLVFNRTAILWEQTPGEIVHSLVLSGPYPLITWLTPFALGMWIGRQDLRADTMRVSLVVAGLSVALGAVGIAAALQTVFGEPGFEPGWAELRSISAHSQMPLWLYGATGLAVALVGFSLFLADLCGRVLWPLVATGQVALSFYVAHLLALTEWPGAMQSEAPAEALWISLSFTVVAAALAVAWRSVLPHGPLEMLLQPPWLAARRWVSARR